MHDGDRTLHELLLELDRLEELREDLLELGVRTLEEIEARIERLHRSIDQLTQDEDEGRGSV